MQLIWMSVWHITFHSFRQKRMQIILAINCNLNCLWLLELLLLEYQSHWFSIALEGFANNRDCLCLSTLLFFFFFCASRHLPPLYLHVVPVVAVTLADFLFVFNSRIDAAAYLCRISWALKHVLCVMRAVCTVHIVVKLVTQPWYIWC